MYSIILEKISTNYKESYCVVVHPQSLLLAWFVHFHFPKQSHKFMEKRTITCFTYKLSMKKMDKQ